LRERRILEGRRRRIGNLEGRRRKIPRGRGGSLRRIP